MTEKRLMLQLRVDMKPYFRYWIINVEKERERVKKENNLKLAKVTDFELDEFLIGEVDDQDSATIIIPFDAKTVNKIIKLAKELRKL